MCESVPSFLAHNFFEKLGMLAVLRKCLQTASVCRQKIGKFLQLCSYNFFRKKKKQTSGMQINDAPKKIRALVRIMVCGIAIGGLQTSAPYSRATGPQKSPLPRMDRLEKQGGQS